MYISQQINDLLTRVLCVLSLSEWIWNQNDTNVVKNSVYGRYQFQG